MRVLLTGATGFVGRHVAAGLLDRGHQVVAAVRDTAAATRRFPGIRAFEVDMSHMASADAWRPLLVGVDAVVNCAGILQSGRGQHAAAIHDAAPRALFDACVGAGVRRVVQISAVSADAAAGTEYALTKKAADDHLRTLDLDWTVLRPSLVYASGSFGGTSLMRGLAGLPLLLPVPGDGGQRFQPIHADDLAETVARCLEGPARRTLDPVGPETLTLRAILERLRAWLDFPPAPVVGVPMALVGAVARLGDLSGTGPLRSTSVAQMTYGNVSDPAAFATAIGFAPRRLDEALRRSPSHVQDRWHARLYFLRPLLTVTLVLLWAGSGIAGLLEPPSAGESLLAALGLPEDVASRGAVPFCLADVAVGVVLALGWRPRLMGVVQLGLVAFYTVALTVIAPGLWLDPFGALLKNLPVLAAIAAWMALRDER